jgi:hypothetical protein
MQTTNAKLTFAPSSRRRFSQQTQQTIHHIIATMTLIMMCFTDMIFMAFFLFVGYFVAAAAATGTSSDIPSTSAVGTLDGLVLANVSLLTSITGFLLLKQKRRIQREFVTPGDVSLTYPYNTLHQLQTIWHSRLVLLRQN